MGVSSFRPRAHPRPHFVEGGIKTHEHNTPQARVSHHCTEAGGLVLVASGEHLCVNSSIRVPLISEPAAPLFNIDFLFIRLLSFLLITLSPPEVLLSSQLVS